jgi:hypothetical protein
MTLEEVKEQIELLFNPEPDEGEIVRRAFACPRLEKTHNLDLSYLKTIDWEGSSMHPHTRLCGAREDALDQLTRKRRSATRHDPKWNGPADWRRRDRRASGRKQP